MADSYPVTAPAVVTVLRSCYHRGYLVQSGCLRGILWREVHCHAQGNRRVVRVGDHNVAAVTEPTIVTRRIRIGTPDQEEMCIRDRRDPGHLQPLRRGLDAGSGGTGRAVQATDHRHHRQTGCGPVSYTHLDVYKRQGGRSSW